MLTLPGYYIEREIHQGVNTIIYGGIEEQTRQPVIIKILKSEFPTLEQITRLKHEYKIAESLDSDSIVKAYSLETAFHRLALILEDFGGDSLKKLLSSQKVNITDCLKIALQLASALKYLHQNQIIHKDIKPDNIIVNPQTGIVKLADFSIASRLGKENPQLGNPNSIEGTIAYMSPEQTGRMNRTLDYRTDFYSLGVTFYEMVTGVLPFQRDDPLALIHCHIAKQPIPLPQLNPEIPDAISEIAMKLLAKNAEDRYQSADGLKADLENCLNQLETIGEIRHFILGQLDRSGQLLIPQKLYGRQAEIERLRNVFERVSQGNSEMVLVSGYSGIGKTSVVLEIHKSIARLRGYFIAGKFDQFKRNIPYAAIVQAFQALMRQLLGETAANLQAWKERILAAVGQQGKVIIEVIPEVELIIGIQPEVPPLGPTEAQNRFNLVFKEFISVFTQKECPLVIFLDDLQWADSASLKLMQLLISDAPEQSLLLIGAYRDNEVGSAHPLRQAIAAIEKNGTAIHNIVLNPLNLLNVTQLITDALTDSINEEKPRLFELSKFLFNVTGGNPFFLGQFLQFLGQYNLIRFDFIKARWQWNVEEIQAVGMSDRGVVELVASNIQKLPAATQQVLKLAACIGNQFNLELLSTVNEQSPSVTARQLWLALKVGLILPLSEAYKIPLVFEEDWELEQSESDNLKSLIAYKFLHDRVQQAAYSLIPKDDKRANHLKIGRLLLQNTPPENLEESIFDIVNHLNVGIEEIQEQSEKERLSELNLMAGRKARSAAAYEAAVRYLRGGLELLSENSWQRRYELTLALHVETAEAEYLNANFGRSARLTEVALEQVTTLFDKVKVYEVQMQIAIAQLEMSKAIDIGLHVLEELGVSLATLTGDDSLLVELPNIANLEQIPELTDSSQLSALRILKSLCAPVFFAKPDIFPSVMLTMVNICRERGHSALAAFAYAFYGLLLSGLGKLDAGYHSGILALRLLEQFKAKELKAQVYNLFNGNIRPWKENAKNCLAPLQEGFQSGLETGNLEWASYCAGNYCAYSFFTEDRLEAVVQQQGKYIDLLVKMKEETSIYYAQTWRQLGLNLLGKAADKLRLIGENFDEEQILPRLIDSRSGTVLFVFYLAKTILLYQFRDYQNAIASASSAAAQAGSAFGFLHVAVLNFYHSLALLADFPLASDSDRDRYLTLVEDNQQKMQHWAHHAPENFQHKYELVEAEKARVLGQPLQAMECYDASISKAKQSGYLQEEALANELAADFYLAMGREKVAKTYMAEAYYLYIRWGAMAKVKNLEERYPYLVAQKRSPQTVASSDVPLTETTGTSAKNLDLATVLKAAQILSSEIVLEPLLEKIMRILIENIGAQKGYLILVNKGNLLIEAEGSVEADSVTVGSAIAVENALPASIINYVARTLESVVLNEAAKEGQFINDPYILERQPKSILCVPLLKGGKLINIVYLENNLTAGAFTAERLEVLKLLSAQAAISIENAKLYSALRESESRLAQFLEAVPVGVFVLDASGKPYYANQKAQQILGRGIVANVSDKQLAEVYQVYLAGSEQEYPNDKMPVVRALKGESSDVDDIEIHQGDKIVPLEVWGTPIYDDRANIAYAIVAFQDITERKKAETERQKFTTELFKLNVAYQRFVPSQFLQLLNKESILDVELGDRVQQEMSLLFADIRDFTQFSESMTPEETFKFINSYLSCIEPSIVLNNGFIDKYMGDGIMALFNGSADEAVKAGIAMLQRLVDYNEERQKAGCVPIRIGIGINTGSPMLGTVGGYNRMDGTAIGDAVNLASRIESLTKDYGVSLLISHHTFLQLQDSTQYAIRVVDRVKVKGKSEAVSVFEVFDADPPELREGKLATLTIFEQALVYYYNQNFQEAIQLFQACLRINAGDKVAQIYLDRCQKSVEKRENASAGIRGLGDLSD